MVPPAMSRSLVPFVLVVPACCDEPSARDSDDTGEASGASTTETPPTTTGAPPADSTSTSTPATSSAETSSDTGVDSTATDPAGSTGAPPAACDWPLDWATTPRKDVLVLVHEAPANLDALLLDAQTRAGDDLHIAVGSTCSEAAADCGATPGYEHISISEAGTDPIGLSSEVWLDVSIFRPLVPDHLFVVTDVDTTYDEMTLGTDPRLAGAQVHVRYLSETCNERTNLELLAMASGGTFACDQFMRPEILEGTATSQPSCELFGDVRDGPGGGGPIEHLTLQGDVQPRPAEIVLDGPGVCDNEPDGWTFIDASTGHVRLCPVTCRNVGRWDPASLSATVAFPCR